MLKVPFSASLNSAVNTELSVWCVRLAMRNMMHAIVMDGTVVMSIYRICVNRGVSVTDDASTVVSERGDILSPKYAPDSMAPAVHPAEKPSAIPMPMKAVPMVATVVQELPVISETREHMRHTARRNIFGERTLRP